MLWWSSSIFPFPQVNLDKISIDLTHYCMLFGYWLTVDTCTDRNVLVRILNFTLTFLPFCLIFIHFIEVYGTLAKYRPVQKKWWHTWKTPTVEEFRWRPVSCRLFRNNCGLQIALRSLRRKAFLLRKGGSWQNSCLNHRYTFRCRVFVKSFKEPVTLCVH